jgi:flagellar hook-associated protein 2
MITATSLAATYSSAVTYNAATGTTTTSDASNITANATTASGQLSATVAAKVTQALAPATAGIKQLNTSLTQGQTRLSALGQVQSAIADFQNLAKGLGGMTIATADGAATAPVSAADMKTRVQSFVSAYNALSTKLSSLQSGDMKTDPGLAQVSAQMTQALRDAGGTSSTGALSKAGISLSSGQLKIDDTKLSAALTANPAAVGSLLTGNGNGVADKLSSKLAALTTAGGAIGRETASTTKDISTIESKRASMTKMLTSTATQMAAMYTQQEQADNSSGTTSLFDMMG